jgi:hypothetical protein
MYKDSITHMNASVVDLHTLFRKKIADFGAEELQIP